MPGKHCKQSYKIMGLSYLSVLARVVHDIAFDAVYFYEDRVSLVFPTEI